MLPNAHAPWEKTRSALQRWARGTYLPKRQNASLPVGQNTGLLGGGGKTRTPPMGKTLVYPLNNVNLNLIHSPVLWAKRRNAIKDAMATLSVFHLGLRVGGPYSPMDGATLASEKNMAYFAHSRQLCSPPLVALKHGSTPLGKTKVI